jgi:AmiR/NasT family two-component response regulator
MMGTSTEGSIEDVGVAISFVDDQVVFAVRGRTAVLRTRQVIAPAIGIVMEREGISEEGAFTVLRGSSQRSGRPRREHAEGVVASTGAPGLNDPASSF